MAIIETKLFNGAKLNSDDAIEYQQPTDLLDGLNVRIQTQENNKQGLVVTLEGTREISRSLPPGTNTVIRAKEFSEVKKAYIFTKNSNGNHRIEEFDYIAETFVTLFEDKSDSAGVQLLNWTDVEYIKDLFLVQSTLLYWVEFPTDIIRRIDVVRARNSDYGVFTVADLRIGVNLPNEEPSALYVTDETYNKNTLYGKTFQFRYKYLYSNNEESAWSPVSNRPVPATVPDQQYSLLYNKLIVTVPLNPDGRYTGIEIAVKIDNGLWQTVRTLNREYIEDLPVWFWPVPQPPPPLPPNPPQPYQDEGNIKEVIPGQGFVTVGYRFSFKNDQQYIPIPDNETNQLYDSIPLSSRAAEVVNDNTILLGNNRYGYPMPDYNQQQVFADFGVESAPAVPGTYSVAEFRNTKQQVSGGTLTTYTIVFSGTPVENDSTTIRWTLPTTYPITATTYTKVVTSALAGDLLATVNDVASGLGYYSATNINAAASGSDVVLTFDILYPLGTITPIPKTAFVEGASVDLNVVNKGSVKTGTSYKLAVFWYDDLDRPFPMYTNSAMRVDIPTLAELGGGIPYLTWNIPQEAPEGAAYYKIGVSKNGGIGDVWYTTTHRSSYSTGPAGTFYRFDIAPLFTYGRDNDTVVTAYDFVQGDRVRIHAKVSTTGGVEEWYNDPVLDYHIDSFFIDTDSTPATYDIKISTDGPLSQIDETSDYLIEIYRPIPATSEEAEVYYELPETYAVVNGENSVTSGSVDFVDAYYRLRRMYFLEEADYGYVPVESLHFSDLFESKYGNLGRPRAPYDVPEDSVFDAEIRYSREWISGSRINGIVRFYPEDIYDAREPMYGASETYGGIQYLTNRENRVICLQELKVGYIPVNRSIIEDVVEQQQIGISSKLLNPITYYAGPNIGIGKDYAIPSFKYVNGSCYFIDPVEMLPVRAGLDGTRYIASKYSGALKAKIRNAVQNGAYIHSVWDDRFNEWLLVFDDYTYVYDESVDGWTPKRSFLPQQGFTANDRLYTAQAGQLYIHDDEENRNVFYGEPYPGELEFALTSPGVKNYQSLEVHADDPLTTTDLGISTQLGQVSELNQEGDFTYNGEGVYTANFLRADNSPGGIISGDRLKGRYIRLHLYTPQGSANPAVELNLLKVVVKSAISSHNTQ